MTEPQWPAPATQADRGVDDADVRESVRVMQQQRTAKAMLVVIGIIVGIAALFIATWFGYKDEPNAVETPPTAVPPP